MRIQDMFEKRLDRPINGVVKADRYRLLAQDR